MKLSCSLLLSFYSKRILWRKTIHCSLYRPYYPFLWRRWELMGMFPNIWRSSFFFCPFLCKRSSTNTGKHFLGNETTCTRPWSQINGVLSFGALFAQIAQRDPKIPPWCFLNTTKVWGSFIWLLSSDKVNFYPEISFLMSVLTYNPSLEL